MHIARNFTSIRVVVGLFFRLEQDPEKSNNGGSGGDDGGNDDNGMPQSTKVESVEETEKHLTNMDEYIARMEESSDSESEEEQCEAEKQDYRVDIVNDKLVLRMTRGNNSASVGEQELRKKIYHAPDFGLVLPRDLDLDYVKSLLTT